jgi:hypothetical protein
MVVRNRCRIKRPLGFLFDPFLSRIVIWRVNARVSYRAAETFKGATRCPIICTDRFERRVIGIIFLFDYFHVSKLPFHLVIPTVIIIFAMHFTDQPTGRSSLSPPTTETKLSKTRRARASRACENCRKRKVKCSEGEVCNECRRFGEQCRYREHYRAKKEFSVRILQSPDFAKKPPQLPPTSLPPSPPMSVAIPSFRRRASSTASMSLLNYSFANRTARFLTGINQNELLSTSSIRTIERYLDNSDARNRPMTIEQLHDRHLTEEQMLQMLSLYFDMFHPSMPILDPDVWRNKAKSVWRANEYGTSSPCTDVELGIVYMLISLGCISCSGTQIDSGKPEWATEYNHKARKMVPDLFEVASVHMAQYMMLICVSKIIGGQTRPAYLYAGAIINNARALGLHKVNPTSGSIEDHERYRVWFCAKMLEQYTSLRVGRASSVVGDASPTVSPAVFFDGTTGIGYLSLRTRFIWMCSQVMADVLPLFERSILGGSTPTDPPIAGSLGPSYDNGPMMMMATVVSALHRIDAMMSDFDGLLANTDAEHLRSDDIRTLSSLDCVQARQWTLLYTLVWHLKTVMYRPFLIVWGLAAHRQGLGADLMETLRNGAHNCVNAALKTVSLLTNGKTGINVGWLITTNIIMAATSVVYYRLTGSESLPGVDEALEQCVTLLNETQQSEEAEALSALNGIVPQDMMAMSVVPAIVEEFADTFFCISEYDDLVAAWLQAMES